MRSFIAIALVTVVGIACQEEVVERPFPRVRTLGAYDITTEGVSLKGEITYTPGEITDHGFAVSLDPGLTDEINKAEVVSLGTKSGKGTFNGTLNTTFVANRIYYVRAFAKGQDYRIVFGELQEFKVGG